MSKKKYDGYRSYSYLKEGEDYQAIPLAKEIDRVPSTNVVLSDAEEKRGTGDPRWPADRLDARPHLDLRR